MKRAERRLEELSAEHGLLPSTRAALLTVLEHVQSDPTAPTTLTDPGQGVDAHLADSLVGLEVPAIRAAGRIADLGAGAGFPGLVLAASLPRASVALVESVSRKCAFLERVVAAAQLCNAEVICERAEAWSAGLGRCDVITARALAPLDALAEYAAPLLCQGGALVAWKGRRDSHEEEAGDRAAGVVGLELAEVRPVKPFASAEHRHLYVYLKVCPTPERFPRRPGMARKRPLGRSSAR